MTIYERTIVLSLLLLECDKCPIPVTLDLSLHEPRNSWRCTEEYNHFHSTRDTTSQDVSVNKGDEGRDIKILQFSLII